MVMVVVLGLVLAQPSFCAQMVPFLTPKGAPRGVTERAPFRNPPFGRISAPFWSPSGLQSEHQYHRIDSEMAFFVEAVSIGRPGMVMGLVLVMVMGLVMGLVMVLAPCP